MLELQQQRYADLALQAIQDRLRELEHNRITEDRIAAQKALFDATFGQDIRIYLEGHGRWERYGHRVSMAWVTPSGILYIVKRPDGWRWFTQNSRSSPSVQILNRHHLLTLIGEVLANV